MFGIKYQPDVEAEPVSLHVHKHFSRFLNLYAY